MKFLIKKWGPHHRHSLNLFDAVFGLLERLLDSAKLSSERYSLFKISIQIDKNGTINTQLYKNVLYNAHHGVNNYSFLQIFTSFDAIGFSENIC